MPSRAADVDARPFVFLKKLLKAQSAEDASSLSAELGASAVATLQSQHQGLQGEETVQSAVLSCLLELARINCKAADVATVAATHGALNEATSAALASIWATHGDAVRKHARSTPFGGRDGVLVDAEWEVHMPIAQGSAGACGDLGDDGDCDEARQSDPLVPMARLQLRLAPGVLGAAADRASNVTVEMTRDELLDTFQQIETIQAQLDAITK
ncbi:hypothetical protein RI054_30g120010 [Pseudoscourfieldia marina]